MMAAIERLGILETERREISKLDDREELRKRWRANIEEETATLKFMHDAFGV